MIFSKKKRTPEQRLGGGKPSLTILILSLGPLASQLVEALYGIVDSMWIGNTIGDPGLSAIGSSSPLDWIPKGVGFGIAVSANSQISYLLGLGQRDKAGRIINDLLVFSIILGIIFPAILLPCVKPYVAWLGGDAKTQADAFEFLLPLLGGSFVTLLYLLLCGALQAEGRTTLYGILQVVSLVLNMGVFDPLFLLGFKTTIWGSSMATILAELLPSLVLLVLYYKGKFNIKPSIKDFHLRFSNETWNGLKTGSSEIVSNLAVVPPSIILNRMMGDAARRQDIYEPVMAAWNANAKMYQIIISTTIAFTMGYIVAAAYAFGAKLYRRFIRLTIWCFVYSLAAGLLFQVPVLIAPRFFGRFMTSNEVTLDWTEKLTYAALLLTAFGSIRFVVNTILQSLQMNLLAFIFSIITILVAIPVFAYMIYYLISKDDILWIARSYLLFDGFAIVASLITMIYPLRFIKRLQKQEALEADVMQEVIPVLEYSDELSIACEN